MTREPTDDHDPNLSSDGHDGGDGTGDADEAGEESGEGADVGGSEDIDVAGDVDESNDDGDGTTARYTAVVDRHEGAAAVLVLEADGRAVGELVVDVDDLPPDGRAPDSVLSVTVADGELVDISHRPSETDRRRESARDRFARLSRRLGSDDRRGDGDGDGDTPT